MQLLVAGNRPQKLGGFNNYPAHRKIFKYIENRIKELQPNLVYTGMALGVDQWAAQACIKLDIPFVACVPFKNQHIKWSAPCVAEYNRILNSAAKIVYVDRVLGYINGQPDRYSTRKLMTRNKYMVDQLENGDVLLAICEISRRSGTHVTLDMVRDSKKDIEIILASPESIVPGLFPGDELPF